MYPSSKRRYSSLRLIGCLTLILSQMSAIFAQGAPPVPQSAGHRVAGVILDPSGAVIAEATVILRKTSDRSERTATTDQRGEFHFTEVASGDYEVEARKEGFKLTVTTLAVGAKTLPWLRLMLPIADVHEEIAVGDQTNQVTVSPDDNLNVIKVDRETLKNLPVLGNDVIATMANLLDAGSLGTGGPTVIIDGLESTRRRVPASQIQDVRINQNPYSAEFSRPGRGRIEVITKAGSPEYHGELNFIFRDHRLNARNAFASERPPEQRRNYDGNLTGPIGSGKNSSFLFGVEREEEDLQAVVFALTPSGVVSENVATPTRETELTFRFNHQPDSKTTLSLRYEFANESSRNDGVGGFNLSEVAVHSTEREHELYFTYRRIISQNMVNEFTLRAERERGTTRGELSDVPRLVVLDAFTGGSSQEDVRTAETSVQLNEIISWNRGKHFVRAGVNIPTITRYETVDRTNFGGTFTFSTLEDFLNARPFLFTINQGDDSLRFWRKEFGLFVQDNLHLRRNLTVALGLRYDWQNGLGDRNNLAPRLSFAYAPDKDQKTVVRGGAGIFYDRTGSGPLGDRLRFDGQRLRQVTITNPSYPAPLAAGDDLAAQPANIVRFAPDLHSPYTMQLSLGVERQLSRSLTSSASYIHTRGVNLFRSRNINAPPPPFYLEPPDPTVGILRQIESSAQSRAHALELVLRGRIGRFFNGTAQYTLGHARNNAGGINSLPADNYDLTGEWSRAEFDERHRFRLLGSVEAGDWFNVGVTLSLSSGSPYSLTTGRDDNRDSIASDRPAGVRRNSLQGPGSATLDVRWSKEFALKKAQKDEGPTLTIGIDAFNVFNRVNYRGFVGNQSSRFFGLPVAAQSARQLQLTLGFGF